MLGVFFFTAGFNLVGMVKDGEGRGDGGRGLTKVTSIHYEKKNSNCMYVPFAMKPLDHIFKIFSQLQNCKT